MVTLRIRGYEGAPTLYRDAFARCVRLPEASCDRGNLASFWRSFEGLPLVG